ncbi:MAG: hypothetical protein ACO3Y3_12505 [Phycisphaerales bacterium]
MPQTDVGVRKVASRALDGVPYVILQHRELIEIAPHRMHLANDLVQHFRVAFHGVGVAPDHAAEGLRLEKLVRHPHPPAAGDHVDRDRRRDAQVGLRRVVE